VTFPLRLLPCLVTLAKTALSQGHKDRAVFDNATMQGSRRRAHSQRQSWTENKSYTLQPTADADQNREMKAVKAAVGSAKQQAEGKSLLLKGSY